MLRTSCFVVVLSSLAGCADEPVPVELTAMVEIRGGLTYTFGSTDFCAPPDTAAGDRPNCTNGILGGFALVPPPLEVTLQAFAIDEHEVTNAQYRDCVAHKRCPDLADNVELSLGHISAYRDRDFADYPVSGVTWFQAEAYCAFAGKRLPNELEWERVARGNPDDGIDRPIAADGLSDVSDCRATGSGDGFAIAFCSELEEASPVLRYERDVVHEGDQAIHGLLGNVAEWTDSWADPNLGCKTDPPCVQQRECESADDVCITESKNCPACEDADDCYYMCLGEPLQTIVCTPFSDAETPVDARAILPSGGSGKVIRGASYATPPANACQLRSSRPNDKRGVRTAGPSSVQPDVGFRCARTLEPLPE